MTILSNSSSNQAPLGWKTQVASIPIVSIYLAAIFFHVLISIVITFVPMVSTPYALIVIGISIVFALIGSNNSVYGAAYIAGAEIFWRMTAGANIFWETGKYAIILVLLLSILYRKKILIPPLMLLFFLSLLPGLLGINNDLPFSRLLDQIRFYGSGHLALFICAIYFYRTNLRDTDLIKIFQVMILPIISIASYATINIILNPNIIWVDESNSASSGGFGPNQVSTILGLGILLAFLLILNNQSSRSPRPLFVILFVWFLIQTMLTFSRGGLYTALISIGVYILVSKRQSFTQLFVILLAIGLFSILFLSIVLPVLDNYTDGKLSVRLQDTNTTGRDRIDEVELETFLKHPEGVGVGMLVELRGETLSLGGVASHNEFTRLLAEHGILGLLAILYLMTNLFSNYTLSRFPVKAYVATFVVWSFLTLGHSAFRLAAPAFLLGLTFIPFTEDELI